MQNVKPKLGEPAFTIRLLADPRYAEKTIDGYGKARFTQDVYILEGRQWVLATLDLTEAQQNKLLYAQAVTSHMYSLVLQRTEKATFGTLIVTDLGEVTDAVTPSTIPQIDTQQTQPNTQPSNYGTNQTSDRQKEIETCWSINCALSYYPPEQNGANSVFSDENIEKFEEQERMKKIEKKAREFLKMKQRMMIEE